MSRCRCNDKLECAKKLSRLYIAADEIKASLPNIENISDDVNWLMKYSANTYMTINEEELTAKIKESNHDIRMIRDSLIYKINVKANEMEDKLSALKEEDRIFHEEEARRLEEELLRTQSEPMIQ